MERIDALILALQRTFDEEIEGYNRIINNDDLPQIRRLLARARLDAVADLQTAIVYHGTITSTYITGDNYEN